ncbi:MAG: phosphotransferase [Candidatus Latescibacteria bacterium]|nr:phosphotransferase [Candidatus Latescibacterota bacterium]
MRRCTKMRETTRLTGANIYLFLRRFAKGIRLEDLKPIPSGLYGASFIFAYGTDKILKVNKIGSRPALLKEAKLAEYLSKQELPVTVVAPLQVHPKGFYAIYPRIDAHELELDVVQKFTPFELDTFARSIGGFLSFLHGHDFPDDVLDYIPRVEHDLAAELKKSENRIEFIRQHAPAIDTTRFKEGLDTLRDSLVQMWSITHADLGLGNILFNNEVDPQFAVIDFTDAEVCDPSADIACLAEDLDEGGIPVDTLESVFEYYDISDSTFKQKMKFRILVREIRSVFWNVRRDVRLATKSAG